MIIGLHRVKKSMKHSQEPRLLYAAQITSRQKIEIYVGDITKHKGGLGKPIANNSGSMIQKASDECVKKYGQIQEGQVLLTTEVGRLKFKALVHAVGPIWRGGKFNRDITLSGLYQQFEGSRGIQFHQYSSYQQWNIQLSS